MWQDVQGKDKDSLINMAEVQEKVRYNLINVVGRPRKCS